MNANNTDKILLRPRVTEKSSSTYTFEVAPDATKSTVRMAVLQKYKVKPTKVNIINVAPRAVVYRGRLGKKSGFKKALVYLKPGDKIDLT